MPLMLDVTSASQIQQAANEVDSLNVLINNAGVAIYDDLNNLDVIEQHLAVNFFGVLRVTHAFLPQLKRSKGAIVNNLSLAGLAALPMIPAYSISKAAAFNLTQSLRALLASQGVTVHAVVLGPVDTDMNRGSTYRRPRPSPQRKAFSVGWRTGKRRSFPIPRRSPSPRAGALAQSRRSNGSSRLSCRRARRIWDDVANAAAGSKGEGMKE